MAQSEIKLGFHEMDLDNRLLKAIAKLKWLEPTLIQEKAIPLALEGKDILARAKTGSGKTAAYAIPLIEKILRGKIAGDIDSEGGVRVLVLVPSKELAEQATRNLKELASCCVREIVVVDVSNSPLSAAQRSLKVEKPDVVVGTPSKLLAQLQNKNLSLKESMETLVVDEADLLFSYGYEDDIKTLLSYLPQIYQSFLMSATLSEDVLSLRSLILHNPAILKLEESDLPEESRLSQFHIKCSLEDKFLLIYSLLKLGLVQGKSLLFVNDIDRCYKLKLFLEQFSIKSCVLNSELPENTRCHVVEEFNRGIYDYIIATDEASSLQSVREARKKKKTHGKRKRDKEYGVARGIDFKGVENVINFDFPPSPDSYVHRVGRTARGVECGAALTFVCPIEEKLLSAVETRLSTEHGCDGESTGPAVKPYIFKMAEIEGFRYRVMDALRAVTKTSIREARLKEIRYEMLNSERLKVHFEDNPRDLQVLRHDKVLQPGRVQPHLKHIPSYLVPHKLREPGSTPVAMGDGPPTKLVKRSKGRGGKQTHRNRKDPLKSFSIRAK
ncbi:probable ATP-dependent RNA helicase DDX56 [Halichondria panicea]|uniref:probable ATP-dependent RNA helicase DDX56 n=1 Tax=Halichondria panicea TaxID=6063 RepID=UPI00312B9693